MAYIHAEGYSGGALKHGPFALIEGEEGANGATPIILIILDDEHAHQVMLGMITLDVLADSWCTVLRSGPTTGTVGFCCCLCLSGDIFVPWYL